MKLKNLMIAASLVFSVTVHAVQFQDIQVKGGGYMDWTAYSAGMALAAGNVQIKGTLILDAVENYGRPTPGAGFFSVNESDCVVDTKKGAVNGTVNIQTLMAGFVNQGCIPAFQITGYPNFMSNYYQLQFSPQFEVTIPLAAAPTSLYYKLVKVPGREMWASEISQLWVMNYENRGELTFNSAPPTVTMADLLGKVETKFPDLFPTGYETLEGTEYHGSIWSARIYSTGWVIGVNASGEVWYIAPAAPAEVKFADSVVDAIMAIEGL